MVFVRRRPLLRAAAVGGVGYMAGKKSAQRSQQEAQQNQRPQQQGQGQQEQGEAPASAETTADRIAALSQLKALLDQGVLTQGEFETEKAKLLSGG